MEVNFSTGSTLKNKLPVGWVQLNVSEFFTSISSGKSSSITDGDQYPVFGSTGVIGQSCSYDYQGQKILIARVGANAGKVQEVSGKYKVTDNTLIASPRSDTILGYVRHTLDFVDLNSFVYGSGQPLVTGTLLKNITIDCPESKIEQQAIAEALSDADALIASLEKLIEKQQKIFSYSLKALNFESYSFYGIGGRFIRKKLCELSEIVGGYAFPSASYSHQGEWNIVTISAIQDGYFAASELNKIKSHPSNLSAEQILKENDLLITLTGNVGRVAKVPKGKFLLNQRVAKLIPNKIEADFLYYSLRSEHFFKHLNDEAVGGAQGNISNKDILDYEIFIPNITGDMARILAYLREIDQLITAYILELDKAKNIKAGMMQELLTGRTRLI